MARGLLSTRRLCLGEMVPPGPTAEADAEKAPRRMVVEIDEQRKPRTAATVAQLPMRHLDMSEIGSETLVTSRSIAEGHIVPLLGTVEVATRARTSSTPSHVDHRTTAAPRVRHRCRMHTCRPLSRSAIRQAHVILSGVLNRAVRWRRVATDPIHQLPAAEDHQSSGRFPPDEAEMKLLYLGLRDISSMRGGQLGTGTHGWKRALGTLVVLFLDD